jgi:hypothetical protein
MMMQLLLMISDISNGVRPTYIATRWTARILEENWAQGDEEKILGLLLMCCIITITIGIPTSKLTDRSQSSNENNAIGQVAFLRGLVMPLLTVVENLFNVFKPCLKNIEGMNFFF